MSIGSMLRRKAARARDLNPSIAKRGPDDPKRFAGKKQSKKSVARYLANFKEIEK